MLTYLKLNSDNKKTGNIPVSTSSAKTCGDSCPMKDNGCYAGVGPMAIHWRKVTEGKRGSDWKTFVEAIRNLSDNQLWRHNQAGDLPGEGDSIDVPALAQLVAANKGKRGFTYTHKPMNAKNLKAVTIANDNGFTINLSANNPAHADSLKALGLPVVSVVPANTPDVSTTEAGTKIVVCPAQTRKGVTCSKCALCWKRDRSYIIGFKPHGIRAKRVEEIANLA